MSGRGFRTWRPAARAAFGLVVFGVTWVVVGLVVAAVHPSQAEFAAVVVILLVVAGLLVLRDLRHGRGSQG